MPGNFILPDVYIIPKFTGAFSCPNMNSPVQPDADLNFYSIFCGVFLYETHNTEAAYVSWRDRLTEPEGFYNYVRKTYYENYFNNIFNDSLASKPKRLNTMLDHETEKDIMDNPLLCAVQSEKGFIKFQISYFDRFLFSDGVGIFCFKVQFIPGEEVSYQKIADLLRIVRYPESEVLYRSQKVRLNKLIHDFLMPGLKLSAQWDQYMAQLKHYTVIDDHTVENFDTEKEQVLFELAHSMPVGAISGKSTHSPTLDYYEKVLTKESIFIYNNWKAIPLLDSFTRISTKYPDTFKTWEQDYFHIYIYCLYCKFQMYYFSNHLTQTFPPTKKTVKLIDKFYEFVTGYMLSSVSYKFLPNLLYEKMKEALEIQKDVESMEKKVKRLTEVFQDEKNLIEEMEPVKPTAPRSIIPGYEYDIFISYRQHDNLPVPGAGLQKGNVGWVSEFVMNLKRELAATLKEPVSIYVDSNPEDGLLENHHVKKSLESKLRCLIFIPILSQTYCDSKSFAWQHEFMAFNRMALDDRFGRDIKLENGNVSSRLLPVRIHELDADDKRLIEDELGSGLRAIDFIYSEAGVNRPLRFDDQAEANFNKTSYRNQINKVANAVKGIVRGLRNLERIK
jgi:hypothetical protein